MLPECINSTVIMEVKEGGWVIVGVVIGNSVILDMTGFTNQWLGEI